MMGHGGEQEDGRALSAGGQAADLDHLRAVDDGADGMAQDRLDGAVQILLQIQGRLGGAYTWIKELGNKGRHGQTIELADPVEGFARLGRLIARHRTVILLCACANLEKCHRLYIAKQIEDALGAGEGWVEHLAPAPKAEQERMAFA